MGDVNTNTQGQPENNTDNQQNVGANASQTNTPDMSALFNKLDEIVAKRTDGILKSILKDNGFDGEDLSGALNDYKAAKTEAANKSSEELSALKAQNAAMRKEIMDSKVNAAALDAAKTLNLNTNYISQIMKIADMSGVVDGDKINKDKLSEALKKVGDECSLFKNADDDSDGFNGSGFVNIGADNKGDTTHNKPNDTSFMAKLRKSAGLKD